MFAPLRAVVVTVMAFSVAVGSVGGTSRSVVVTWLSFCLESELGLVFVAITVASEDGVLAHFGGHRGLEYVISREPFICHSLEPLNAGCSLYHIVKVNYLFACCSCLLKLFKVYR